MDNQKEKSVGAIWINKSQDGEKYLKIKFDNGRSFIAFKNDYKKSDENQMPHYHIFVPKSQATENPSLEEDVKKDDLAGI